MKKNDHPHSLISQEELELLMGGKKGQASGVDTGFKYRNAYVLLVATMALVRSIFFPEIVQQQLNLIDSVGDITSYVQMRGFLLLVMSTVYFFSYIKDWHCEKISLVLAAFALVWLLADSFSFGRFGIGPMQPVMVGTFLLRAGAVYCLLMNSIRDDRAPAMPRTVFS